MNFLTKLLLPKVAGTIGAVMLIAMIALGVTAYVQTNRAETLETQLQACRDAQTMMAAAVLDYRDTNIELTALAQKQSDQIAELERISVERRAIYNANLAKAREANAGYKADAARLLALESTSSEEITRCREARDLLEQELVPQ